MPDSPSTGRWSPLRLPLLLGAGVQLAPSVLALRSVRDVVGSRLCGAGRAGHIALTFDDGPDPRSTPHVLDTLAALDVRATFFVLGAKAERHPDLVRRAAREGHDIAVHGWTHRCQLLQSPVSTAAGIARATRCVGELTGTPPRFFRPPYGIPTGAGLTAARRAGLRTVFWTAWGRDWGSETSAGRVTARVRHGIEAGGTVLLHDASSAGVPRTRQITVPAVVALIPDWRAQGYVVGPLSEHGLAPISPDRSGP